MKMYYEEVFILNFLLDFMILYGTKRILKINSNLIRIIISSLIGSLTTFILLIDISSLNLLLLKILLSLLLIIIAFGFNNLLKNIFYFYLISMIIGGVFYLFDINSNLIVTHILLVLGSFIIIFILIREFMSYKDKYTNKYLVNIYYNKKCYRLEGFIDTGNRLISNYKNEVVILTNLNIDTKRLIYVPYKALNTSGVIPCIRPDRVVINNKEFNDCLIGLSKSKFSISGINCILPNKYKEELC